MLNFVVFVGLLQALAPVPGEVLPVLGYEPNDTPAMMEAGEKSPAFFPDMNAKPKHSAANIEDLIVMLEEDQQTTQPTIGFFDRVADMLKVIGMPLSESEIQTVNKAMDDASKFFSPSTTATTTQQPVNLQTEEYVKTQLTNLSKIFGVQITDSDVQSFVKVADALSNVFAPKQAQAQSTTAQEPSPATAAVTNLLDLEAPTKSQLEEANSAIISDRFAGQAVQTLLPHTKSALTPSNTMMMPEVLTNGANAMDMESLVTVSTKSKVQPRQFDMNTPSNGMTSESMMMNSEASKRTQAPAISNQMNGNVNTQMRSQMIAQKAETVLPHGQDEMQIMMATLSSAKKAKDAQFDLDDDVDEEQIPSQLPTNLMPEAVTNFQLSNHMEENVKITQIADMTY